MKKISSLVTLLFFISFLAKAQNSSKKFLLIEEFTNTYCPTCIDKHPQFEQDVLKKYENSDIFHIAYHHSTPISDNIFYQFNPEEEDERAAYYQVQGTPSVLLEGQPVKSPIFVDDPLLPQEKLDENLDLTAPVEILVDEIVDGDERMVKIKVNVMGDLPSGSYRLQTAVVEREINYEPPFEGMETRLVNVFRQTLKGWEGSNFISVSAGNSLNYDFKYTINPIWNEAQIYVIAFLQNTATGHILNAGSSWGKREIVGVKNVDTASTPPIMTLENPVFEELNIKFNQNAAISNNLATINIFDTLGNKVLESTFLIANSNLSQSLNLQTLPKGIYIVNAVINNVKVSKKILKLAY